MWARERIELVAVSRGARPADRYVRGGLLLNVYTGETYPANVAVRGERIAYVGLRDDMVGPRTEIIDAGGRTLVPGYIEPHAHPWNLATPAALARHVLPLGTTAIFGDNLTAYELGGLRGFESAAAALAHGPLRFYWLIRPHGQSPADGESRRFSRPAIRRMLGKPWSAAMGEVTRWPDVLAGRRDLFDRLALASAAGKRIEGHTAGAGPEKLPGLAAAGFSSDHEPISAAEAIERARLGIALMLRQSSLRPDLRALLAPFVKAGAFERVMLTTDGSSPSFIARHGFVDNLVRLAIEEGVPPATAYRMVTLHPASYYGKDADLGGIAPGRYADILLLGDILEPRPAAVIARGRLVARDGQSTVAFPEPPWRRIFTPRSTRLDRTWRLAAEELELGEGTVPVLRLVSAVITQLDERPLRRGDLHAALLDRRGEWITTAGLSGFAPELDGLATTLSTDCQILAAGRRPEAMAQAVNRLLEMKGGLVVVDGRRVAFELPLPLGGLMATGPLLEMARREDELKSLLAARGYAFHDPLFTLYFMAADFLPSVRLTGRGVWDVRRARVVSPSRRRRSR
ncbi:MAG TPA: adenine deaminase C-terminal domain-containing protein [Candidatus Methylomirabilis sp.]|nr:adenine deaminase C-terminal domain-containing protein [Candidatus Methylomirabilis sp.]